MDLALMRVEEDLGHTVALPRSYRVVFLKRPGGQAQFSAALSLHAAEDRFGAVHDWINEHLAGRHFASGSGEPGRDERAQFQSALFGGNRANGSERKRCGAVSSAC